MLVGNVVVGLASVAAAAAIVVAVEDMNSPPASTMTVRIRGKGHSRVEACYRCICCHWTF